MYIKHMVLLCICNVLNYVLCVSCNKYIPTTVKHTENWSRAH